MCRLALLLLVGAVTATGATCPADSKHRCTSVESIAAGSFSGETWVPDSGCFVATPTPEEMLRILRGSWLVICGRSNAMVTSRALMNQVSPHAFMPYEEDASLVDLVMEGDEQLHLYGKTFPEGRSTNETAYMEAALARAAETAAHTDQRFRITFRNTPTWPSCTDLIRQLRDPRAAAGGWHTARVVFWTQSGAWYQYLHKEANYYGDLDTFMIQAESVCDDKQASGPGATACVLVPSSCPAPACKKRRFLREAQAALKEQWNRTAERRSKFHYYDITLQIGQRQEEFPAYHVTPMLALWQLWGMINALPEAAPVLDPPDGGSACPADTVAFEPLCKAFDGGRSTLPLNSAGCDCHCPKFERQHPSGEVVDTVGFSIRLDTGRLVRAGAHGEQASPGLAALLEGEQADAIRSSIAGHLPPASYGSATVLLDADADDPYVLVVNVVIPLAPPDAGRQLLQLLRQLTAGSLSQLGGLRVVEILKAAAIEPWVISPRLARQRADAAQRRECLSRGPDIAMALALEKEAAETMGEPGPDATAGEQAQGAGTTAMLLLVGSTTLAVLVASAQSIGSCLLPSSESKMLVKGSQRSDQPKNVFVALNGARLLASIHIVLGHLYQSGYGGGYASSWGFSWVPWFFMLSGYVLTLARLSSLTPEAPQPVLAFVQKRAAVIYPPFAVTLFLGLAQRWWEGEALPKFYHLAAQGVLAQSFVPWLPESTIQVHCWFLSCLVPFWLSFDMLARRVILRLPTLPAAVGLLLFLAALGFLPMILPAAIPGGDPEWYRGHHTGALNTPTDFAIVTLKFNPLAYLHIFVFGMVLARVRQLLSQAILPATSQPDADADERPSTPTAADAPPAPVRLLALIFRLGASLGYFGLLLFFYDPELRPSSFKLSARLSVLMLLQGLILVGLTPLPRPAEPAGLQAADMPAKRRCLRDPIEAVLAQSPAALGDLSYCQYLLQFLVMRLWPLKPISGPLELLGFMALLLGAARLLALLVVRPAATRFLRAKPGAILAGALVVSLLTSAACLADEHARLRAPQRTDACGLALTPPAHLPAYVRVHPEVIDVRLNWTMADAELADAAGGGDNALAAFPAPPALINPSLLWLEDGRLLRAARLHASGCLVNPNSRYNDSQATEIRTVWRSAIMVDAVPPGASAELSSLRVGRGASDLAGQWSEWDEALRLLGGPARPLRPLNLARSSGEDAAPWAPLCPREPRYVEANHSLMQTIVTGAEDPKLLLLSSGEAASLPHAAQPATRAGIAFSSFPPDDGPYACHDPASMMFSGSKAKYQMFFASPAVLGDGWRSTSSAGPGGAVAALPPAVGHRFTCQDVHHANKNWIGFSHAGVLHMITSVQPHAVHAVGEDGQCLSDSFLTDAYEPLRRLTDGADVAVHGSATAIPWRNGTAYLALLHTKDRSNKYHTMAYMFEAQPPFAVTAVSRPLPLAGGRSAFASSLSVLPAGDKVAIGYGAADVEARALVVSIGYMESLMDWSGQCDAPDPALDASVHLDASPGEAPSGPAPTGRADAARIARAYHYSGFILASAIVAAAVACIRLAFGHLDWLLHPRALPIRCKPKRLGREGLALTRPT